MKKNKHKHQKAIRNLNKQTLPKGNILTGQETPLVTSFEDLRKRAMQYPVASVADVTEFDALDRHTKIFTDYNSVYILCTSIYVVKRTEVPFAFYWHIEAFFVSKLTGKFVKTEFLLKPHREALEHSKNLALTDCGNPLQENFSKQKDRYVWKIPFSATDYLQMI